MGSPFTTLALLPAVCLQVVTLTHTRYAHLLSYIASAAVAHTHGMKPCAVATACAVLSLLAALTTCLPACMWWVAAPCVCDQVAEPEMVEKRDRWEALAAQFGVALPAVAFAFASAPSVVAKLVVGPASPEQVEENLRWGKEAAEIPLELWRSAKSEAWGLLAPGTPCPGD